MELGDPELWPICVLGQGTFGKVFLCKNRVKNNQLLCVKKISLPNPHLQIDMILEEIYIFSQLKHPNIVAFERCFSHANSLNIVMEYLPGGTLREVIEKTRYTPLSVHSLREYFSDICLGLEYLHIRHIIHRDLKPENLMLTLDQHVKIGDFGISAIYTDEQNKTRSFGTPLYAAPEVIFGEKGEFSADMWSLGCVLFEMCTGSQLFGDAKNIMDLIEKIQMLTTEKLDCQCIQAKYGENWSKICQKMVIYKANERILIPDLMRIDPMLTITFYHKYFNYKY